MKLCIYSDPHFCTYSSIVRQRGKDYSYRLENLIKSINWVEQTAENLNCSAIVCLGDFFDTSTLSAEELTALHDIKWGIKSHIFLVGNHEQSISDLAYSSTHLFNLTNNSTVINAVTTYIVNDTQLCFIPYISEQNRYSLQEYLGDKVTSKRIVFSHNDIKGIQMGAFLSKDGFDIDDIAACKCDLFINGHLHNSTNITEHAINIGNLTGLNFSEDATKYEHHLMILDTDTCEHQLIENPYAFNFYKFEGIPRNVKLKEESVIALRVPINDMESAKNFLASPNIIASKLLIDSSSVDTEVSRDNGQLIHLNHIEQFSNFVFSNVGNSKIIQEELAEVLK